MAGERTARRAEERVFGVDVAEQAGERIVAREQFAGGRRQGPAEGVDADEPRAGAGGLFVPRLQRGAPGGRLVRVIVEARREATVFFFELAHAGLGGRALALERVDRGAGIAAGLGARFGQARIELRLCVAQFGFGARQPLLQRLAAGALAFDLGRQGVVPCAQRGGRFVQAGKFGTQGVGLGDACLERPSFVGPRPLGVGVSRLELREAVFQNAPIGEPALALFAVDGVGLPDLVTRGLERLVGVVERAARVGECAFEIGELPARGVAFAPCDGECRLEFVEPAPAGGDGRFECADPFAFGRERRFESGSLIGESIALGAQRLVDLAPLLLLAGVERDETGAFLLGAAGRFGDLTFERRTLLALDRVALRQFFAEPGQLVIERGDPRFEPGACLLVFAFEGPDGRVVVFARERQGVSRRIGLRPCFRQVGPEPGQFGFDCRAKVALDRGARFVALLLEACARRVVLVGQGLKRLGGPLALLARVLELPLELVASGARFVELTFEVGLSAMRLVELTLEFGACGRVAIEFDTGVRKLTVEFRALGRPLLPLALDFFPAGLVAPGVDLRQPLGEPEPLFVDRLALLAPGGALDFERGRQALARRLELGPFGRVGGALLFERLLLCLALGPEIVELAPERRLARLPVDARFIELRPE